ncbi:MAG: hypothetical protein P8X90_07410 [Desulfobacterales bacterium]
MPEKTCPVNNLISRLSAAIESGQLKDPRSRRRAEDILALLNDVAWGRADKEHLPAMESLAQKIVEEGRTESSKQTAGMVLDTLAWGATQRPLTSSGGTVLFPGSAGWCAPVPASSCACGRASTPRSR